MEKRTSNWRFLQYSLRSYILIPVIRVRTDDWTSQVRTTKKQGLPPLNGSVPQDTKKGHVNIYDLCKKIHYVICLYIKAFLPAHLRHQDSPTMTATVATEQGEVLHPGNSVRQLALLSHDMKCETLPALDPTVPPESEVLPEPSVVRVREEAGTAAPHDSRRDSAREEIHTAVTDRSPPIDEEAEPTDQYTLHVSSARQVLEEGEENGQRFAEI